MTDRIIGNVPKLLLFDLGGVLIDFSGIRDLPALMRIPVLEAEVRQRWGSCPVIRAFETGEITANQFAERFVKEWDLILSSDAFLKEFRAWVRGFLPGAKELLASLKGQFRLACLSNSNYVHWEDNAQRFEMEGMFEKALSSHQIGSLKPDPEIYRQALSLLNVNPEEVLFFDDNKANISGAHQAGITAYQVEGVDELRTCLQGLGYL
jgi:glucose-1-phosphatase